MRNRNLVAYEELKSLMLAAYEELKSPVLAASEELEFLVLRLAKGLSHHQHFRPIALEDVHPPMASRGVEASGDNGLW